MQFRSCAGFVLGRGVFFGTAVGCDTCGFGVDAGADTTLFVAGAVGVGVAASVGVGVATRFVFCWPDNPPESPLHAAIPTISDSSITPATITGQ